MMIQFGKVRDPRSTGIVCALAATALGIFYLIAAGAPVQYPVVNAAAFVLGLVALRGFGGAALQVPRFSSAIIVLLGACLLATALLGTSVEGASRWIFIGPLSVQVSLVVLPLMITAFARQSDYVGAGGIALAAAALALQPDRAMAGVLALSMALLVIARRERAPFLALLAAAAGFAASLAQPDALPAVPYVDQILFTAFDVQPLAGVAVILGAMLLLVPSLVGLRRDPAQRPAYLVFGALWFGCILAAALGNYPTPVVGYGGSAILGYLLSLAGLPTAVRSSNGLATEGAGGDADTTTGLSERALPA